MPTSDHPQYMENRSWFCVNMKDIPLTTFYIVYFMYMLSIQISDTGMFSAQHDGCCVCITINSCITINCDYRCKSANAYVVHDSVSNKNECSIIVWIVRYIK
eukprot:732854_1